MDGLGMLSQVIEAREASLAVAFEWSLAGMFSDVTSEMLAPCKA